MASKLRIILFEDTNATRDDVARELVRRLRGRGEVVSFAQAQEAANAKARTYEDRLVEILERRPYAGATLILADKDLSKSQHFSGLSVTAVAAAARRLGIPICSYARELAPEENRWRNRLDEGHIVLGFESEKELARKSVLAASGFEAIRAGLSKPLRKKATDSPAKILAEFLGKSEYADKIGLYVQSGQSRPSALQSSQAPRLDLGTMACFLGYWLWNSLLRFPGLLVNQTAAASHLNIATRDFAKPSIQNIFKKALYRGPFSDPLSPQWWRGVLDDIVSNGKTDDGLALARKVTAKSVRACQCSLDSSKPAGYYCIVTEKPVSLDNSRGGLSWFPRGADLTRVRNDKFDELEPWFGA